MGTGPNDIARSCLGDGIPPDAASAPTTDDPVPQEPQRQEGPVEMTRQSEGRTKRPRLPHRDKHVRIVTIVGARPQFIKAAVVSRAIAQRNAADGWRIEESLIHTGQHFDRNMSDTFFEQMGIPEPARHLGIAGGNHGEMTGRMLVGLEQALLELAPDRVLVYGDTNSTLAGALAAAKLNLPVAHVEAGLRSFNRRMPEEINRVVADHVSDLLFAPTEVAVRNLVREGLSLERIFRAGDVMYDAMLHYRPLASERSSIVRGLGLIPKHYVLATVHRAENTDDPVRLRGILEGLGRIGQSMPVICPLHPRTRIALGDNNMLGDVSGGVRLIEPVPYFDMISLEANAALIATDSGGVQKEAYFNQVPCLTMRDETEWVELVEIGANRLVGTDPERIALGFEEAVVSSIGQTDLYGNGQAASVILDELLRRR